MNILDEARISIVHILRSLYTQLDMASKDELMICIVEIINQQYIYQINQDLHHIFYQDLSSTTVSSMYNYMLSSHQLVNH